MAFPFTGRCQLQGVANYWALPSQAMTKKEARVYGYPLGSMNIYGYPRMSKDIQ